MGGSGICPRVIGLVHLCSLEAPGHGSQSPAPNSLLQDWAAVWQKFMRIRYALAIRIRFQARSAALVLALIAFLMSTAAAEQPPHHAALGRSQPPVGGWSPRRAGHSAGGVTRFPDGCASSCLPSAYSPRLLPTGDRYWPRPAHSSLQQRHLPIQLLELFYGTVVALRSHPGIRQPALDRCPSAGGLRLRLLYGLQAQAGHHAIAFELAQGHVDSARYRLTQAG
jgi:hypothetical protein